MRYFEINNLILHISKMRRLKEETEEKVRDEYPYILIILRLGDKRETIRESDTNNYKNIIF